MAVLTPLATEIYSAGGMTFVDTGQRLGDRRSWNCKLGDLDGDGDLDALVVNDRLAQVWLNDGEGRFKEGQQLMKRFSDLDLGDLDDDGDLDAFVVTPERRAEVWLNDGSGAFDTVERLSGEALGYGVALGDLDNDGDLDAYLAKENANMIWLNDGEGQFSDSGQRFGGDDPLEDMSIDVVLADLNGDSLLDVFEVVYSGRHRVWLNDGTGEFVESGQELKVGIGNSHGVAAGDLDDDGDLDVFVTVTDQMAFQVWFNDGGGRFTDSGQRLPSSNAQKVALGDLDGDGDLDAFMANSGNSDEGAGNTVWLNDGKGIFSDTGLRLGNSYSLQVALGDLDLDGDLDAFIVNSYFSNPGVDKSNRVWINSSY
jgi:hypothetical protein